MFRHAGMTVRRVTERCALTREPSRVVRGHSVSCRPRHSSGHRASTNQPSDRGRLGRGAAAAESGTIPAARLWSSPGPGGSPFPDRTRPEHCNEWASLLEGQGPAHGTNQAVRGDCTTSDSRCRDVQTRAPRNREPMPLNGSMGQWYPGEGTEGQEPTDRNCSEAVVAHSMRGSGYKPIQNTTRVQTTRTAPMPIGMLTGSASVSRSPKYITRTTLT